MKQEFFTNTIQSKFIKSMLKSSYLPSIDSCRDGDFLIKNRVYTYKDKIIKCNKSGFIGCPGEVREKIKIYQLGIDSNENGFVYSTKLPIDESMPIEIIGNPEVKSDGGIESIDAEVSGEIASVNVESKESLISDLSISVVGNAAIPSYNFNGIELVEIGKNWFNKKDDVNDTFIFDKHVDASTGKLVNNTTYTYTCTKEFIRVCPNTTYTLTYKHFTEIPSTRPNIFQYRINDTEGENSYKGRVTYTTSKVEGNMFIGTFTTHEDCFFLMINLPSMYIEEVSTLNNRFKMINLQIELGEESTNLEKYFLKSHTINKQTSDHEEKFFLEYDETTNKTIIEFPIYYGDAGIIISNKAKNIYLNIIKISGPQSISQPEYYSYNKISYYSNMYTNTPSSIAYINPHPFLPDCTFKTKIKDKNTLIIKVEDGQSMAGDINKDRILNSEDISLLRRYIVDGYGIQVDTRPYHANYFVDGAINTKDVGSLRIFLGAANKEYPKVQNDSEIVLIYYTPALLTTEYDIIKEYEIFKKSSETQSFVSVENYYDDLTHKRLGKFLRYKRDIEDLDLMPFYNCFCGKWVSEYIIDDNFKVKKSNINTSNKKCALVPIKFNRKYKIAAECNSNIRIVPIIMKDGLLQKANINFQSVDLTEEVNKIESSHLLINNISFEFPIEYSLNTFSLSSNEEEMISKYENYLYILIEINKNINTSIVVLEGDFNTEYTKYILDYNSEFYANTNRFFDNICLSNLSLLKFSDGKSYPFSDRLIEFLLLNVIDNKDTNSNNILLMQNNSNIYKNSNRNLGMYMDYYRRAIYNNISSSSLYTIKGSSGNSFFVLDDITGFVDKDVEKYLKNGGV